MFAGLCGVPLGSYIAQKKRVQVPNCDPIVCAYGAIISSVFVYFVLVTTHANIDWAFAFVFFGMVSLNMCWSLVADMLLVRKEMEEMKRRIGGN